MNQVLLVVGKKRLSPGQLYVYLIRRRRGVRGEEKKKKSVACATTGAVSSFLFVTLFSSSIWSALSFFRGCGTQTECRNVSSRRPLSARFDARQRIRVDNR